MQPKIPCRPVLLLAGVLMIAMSVGCASVPDDSYKLHIVFSGLVPLVYDTDSTTPDSLVALVPDLTEPSQLVFGSEAHGHRSRLLYDPDQVDVDAGGRSVFADGWACACDGTQQTLSYLQPTGENFTLVVDSTETSLTANRGKVSLPEPCDPEEPSCDVDGRSMDDQALDVQWMINIDGLLSRAANGGDAPGLNPRLVAASYRPGEGEPNLLKARFDFAAGHLQSRSLHLEDEDCSLGIATYTIDPLPGESEDLLRQAISREVELVLTVRGPVRFDARALGDPNDAARPVIFHPLPGQKEVILRIDNEPNFDSCTTLKTEMLRMEANHENHPDEEGHLAAFHFLTLYNLVDRPNRLVGILGERPLVPVMTADGPSWNAQCSPPAFNTP